MSRALSKIPHQCPSQKHKVRVTSSGTDTEHLAVLEALKLPVSLVNRRYIYEWVNTRYASVHGKTPEEIIGTTVRSLWGKASEQEIKEKLDRCFKGAEVRDEGWMRFPTLGRRYCEVVYSPYATHGKSVSLAIVVTYDLTDRKELEERLRQRERMAIEQIFMQRDLALRLAQTGKFDEGLTLILETALTISEMESGGIWLKQEATGDFELLSYSNQSQDVAMDGNLLQSASPLWSIVMQGKTVYSVETGKENSHCAIIPILREGQVIGSLILVSPEQKEVAKQSRLTLDFLSAELGAIIARIQARHQLEQEIEMRKQTEKALDQERLSLQEANAALKVLLRHREEDRKELETRFVANVRQLVLPHVEKLKKSRLDAPCATTVDFIQTNLKEILSPFLGNLRVFNLTPRQLEVVALIKAGRTTKDIAEALHVTTEAIDKQRLLIRKKLNLTNEKANLRSYLLSLG